MIRVKIVRPTVAGEPAVIRGVGEILDLADAEARYLIGRGKAEPALAPPPDAAAPAPAHRDPAPTRSRGRR